MAADDLGRLGVDGGPEPVDHLAVGGDQELLEVPLDVAGVALGVGRLGQLLVEGMALLAVDIDLLGDGEGDAVGGRAEGGDLVRRPRLLAAELVARHAEDGEAAVAVLLLQVLEAGVLGGQAAGRGNVDDKDGVAFEVGEIRGAGPASLPIWTSKMDMERQTTPNRRRRSGPRPGP